jgi:hypothetical protein
MTTSPFVLSIETTSGQSIQHGFHLGTDERLAREIAAEKFHARVRHGLPVVTVALLRDRKLVDVYDGTWFNADTRAWWDERA